MKTVECSVDFNKKSPNNFKSENTQSTSPQQHRSSCSPVPDTQSECNIVN